MKTIRNTPLNNLIKNSGISKRDLASHMGITEMRLFQIIKHPMRMRIDQALSIAEYTGIKYNKIIRLIVNN